MPVDESTPLPPDDANAELARRIGKGEEPSYQDPFGRLLLAYLDRSKALAPPSVFSHRLWAKIKPHARPTAAPLRLVPLWTRWAAAAAIVIAFAFWVARESGPTLVSSSSGNIATVTLGDGSAVTLRPYSTLYQTGKNAYMLEGEAFFDVAHNPQRTFLVETDIGQVRVLGTRFDVSTWGGETVVFLERGVVAFTHLATGAVDTLAPGDELVASVGGLNVGPAKTGAEGAMDWMSASLVFGARPLSRIIAEMEHHFDITVLVPDSLKTETLSGQIYLSGPKQSLRDLGTALGGRFEETQPNVYLLAFD